MRISHKHKFVFIAVPRTGSNSIRKALDPFSDIKSPPSVQDISSKIKNAASPYYMHTTSLSLKKHFDKKKWNWDEYYKFGFVRNPWDMVVSSYFYLLRVSDFFKEQLKNDPLFRILESQKEHKDYNFEEFVFGNKHILTHAGMTSDANQIDFLSDRTSERYLVNHIGRFEYIQEDFNSICAELGIHSKKLPHMLKTKHKHYSEYYNSKTKDFIAKKYKRDIDTFGYEFE